MLTGLITIFRKRNHELFASPQNTVGNCCSLPWHWLGWLPDYHFQWAKISVVGCWNSTLPYVGSSGWLCWLGWLPFLEKEIMIYLPHHRTQSTVVDCCSLLCIAVAVLTGLITIFRKRNHELLASPQNTLGDCCFLPYVAMDGPNTWIPFSVRKNQCGKLLK